MSEPVLDPIATAMADIQPEEEHSNINNEQQREAGDSREWGKKTLILEGISSEVAGDHEDRESESQLDIEAREEIKTAIYSGQKTITLSADDAALDAKIMEIMKQSRQLDQDSMHSDVPEQHYIEIINEDGGQVLGSADQETDEDGHRVVAFDLSNFKFVRYQEEGAEDDGSGQGIGGLVVAEHDDADGQHYIHLTNAADGDSVHYTQGSNSQSRGDVQYVQVIEKDKVPLVYFTSEQPKPPVTTSTLTPVKRKRGEFFLPPDAMNSPNFKLFLYNCKLCDFKCNAIKDLTAHKAMHPGIGAGRYRSLAKPPSEKTSTFSDLSPLTTSNMKQYDLVEHCNQCLYKTVSKTHLNKHIAKCHSNTKSKTLDDAANPKTYNSYEACTPKGNFTLYACKSCTFKTDSKSLLRRHKCQEETGEAQEFILS